MTELIAEIGQAHDGSLGNMYAFIDEMANCGVNTMKFQMHIAAAESSALEPFRVKFSKQDLTRFDYWKRMEFSFDQWVEIKKYTEANGMQFLCSPFSMQAFDWMERLEVDRYKIASGELGNFLLLDAIAQTGKKVIISSGMSSYYEIEQAIARFKISDCEIELMQCTTSYPTPASKVGLNVLSEFKQRFNFPVGLSDHSGEIYPGLAAASLGAKHIEFHVAWHKGQFGPDSTSSLIPSQVKQLVDGIKFINDMQLNPMDKDAFANELSPLKKVFGKSLAWRKPLKKGAIITADDLESKKPGGQGINADLYETLLGKKLKYDVREQSFVKEQDYE
jgi:N,N'-diacetyllegionaminate synthase